MNPRQHISEAWKAIRSNWLRAVFTMLIIAFGIMCLIGVLSSIDAAKYGLSNSFAGLGANTFNIQNYESNLRQGGPRQQRDYHPPITYKQSQKFKEKFSPTAPVAVVARGPSNVIGKYGSQSTESNIRIFGADENYILTSNYTIEKGRNFSSAEMSSGASVVMLGKDVEEYFFPDGHSLDRTIRLNGKPFRIIAVYNRVGSGFANNDQVAVIPNLALEKKFPGDNRSFILQVYAKDATLMENLTAEAIGQMRLIRRLKPADNDNFGIWKVEAIISSLEENLSFLTLAATAIGLITLLSAAVGLMNIMLVSVTERTREIGLRKSLGATQRTILVQFLVEALLICQLGGLLGLGFGILIGNGVGYFLGSGFFIPWNWVIFGFSLCLLVGLISGIYPARKAARLDPIEALRHE